MQTTNNLYHRFSFAEYIFRMRLTYSANALAECFISFLNDIKYIHIILLLLPSRGLKDRGLKALGNSNTGNGRWPFARITQGQVLHVYSGRNLNRFVGSVQTWRLTMLNRRRSHA